MRHFLKALLVVSIVILLGACAAAPVQEMSDARQAVTAAAEAGASQYAGESLNSAQTLLDSAESKLEEHLFTGARRDAEAARAEALEALRITLEAKGEAAE